ncbi:MAG: formylglycine-generating enzyme family protein [Bacteroidaceae bacterium]|nr:formylglycine-generating enzyme family protein [Bacteroidaceae bacterium]
MRRLSIKSLFVAFLLLFSLPLSAQKLTVESFVLLPDDATAKDEKYQRTDDNGNFAGLVKVIIPREGVELDGGMVLDQRKWAMGEYWVWMADGATKLTVRAPGFQALEVNFRNYDFQMLHSKNTYKLVITVPATASQSKNNIQTFTVKGVSFNMVQVDGGTFEMGCTANEDSLDRNDRILQLLVKDAKPVHAVTLSTYMIGETEVTQELWEAVMGNNPSHFKGAKNPVENVSWDDCKSFIEKLNLLTGKSFRLPTEAEWEFAARGGNKSKDFVYSGSDTLNDVAWFWRNSGDKYLNDDDNRPIWKRTKENQARTHPVGSKKPNILGCYDMSGNVEEWCNDWYGNYKSSKQNNPKGPNRGIHRVIRGGDCYSEERWCDVSIRSHYLPYKPHGYTGFRLAL